MVNSIDAKKHLASYVSAQSAQYMGGVWESVHHWNADFIAVKWTHNITEFEIKLTRADLRGEISAINAVLGGDIHEQYELWGRQHQRIKPDLKPSHTKIEKHHHYLIERKKDHFTNQPQNDLFIPNLFYFAVPHELVDYAKELTEGMKYGVFDLNRMTIVKRASKLHDEAHSKNSIFHLFSRACTLRSGDRFEALKYAEELGSFLAKEYGHEFGSLPWTRLHATIDKFNKEKGLK